MQSCLLNEYYRLSRGKVHKAYHVILPYARSLWTTCISKPPNDRRELSLDHY